VAELTTDVRRSVLSRYRSFPLLVRLHGYLRCATCPFERIEARVPQAGLIYDIGCGHGVFPLWMVLSAPARTVVGLDISEEKLQIARLAAKGESALSFQCADLSHWEPRRCDAITAIDVLYLIPFELQRRLLRRCFLALPDGGTLLIHRVSRKPFWKFIVARSQELISVRLLHITHGNALYFWKDQELAAFLESLGFHVLLERLDRGYLHPHSLLVCRKETAPDGPGATA
jgi:2-polyprenyl-3-methyl-5-hydroxy-6-metoxy-1,4-benzoquinol methylase